MNNGSGSIVQAITATPSPKARCVTDTSSARRPHCPNATAACGAERRRQRRPYRGDGDGRCPFHRPDWTKRSGRHFARFPPHNADATDG